MPDEQAIESLRKKIHGEVLLPDSEPFRKAMEIWNHRLQQSPAVIVQCQETEDVAEAVRFARKSGMPLTVKGGGHSYAGLAVKDSAMLIDLSPMKGIRIDVQGRRADVQPGVLWSELHDLTSGTGLAACGGTVSSVGVAGFTLGGGSGFLARKHGLAIDNLLSVEIVTAEGHIFNACEERKPDLFWAIRGGGGNFGIVTQFEFRLQPLGEEILSGQVMYAFADARRVLHAFREVMLSAPDELCCYPCFYRIPPIPAFPEDLHGQVVIALVMAYMGDVEDGRSVIQPLQNIVEPIADQVGVQSWMAVNQMFDAGVPHGLRWYSQALDFETLSDAAIDTMIEQSANLQGPYTFSYFDCLGGAIGRVDPGHTAYAGRRARFGFHVLAGWANPQEDAAIIDWAKSFRQAMSPHAADGVYINLLAEDEADRIPDAYGGNLQRLQELKKTWDPDNVFSGNQNIQPAPDSTPSSDSPAATDS